MLTQLHITHRENCDDMITHRPSANLSTLLSGTSSTMGQGTSDLFWGVIRVAQSLMFVIFVTIGRNDLISVSKGLLEDSAFYVMHFQPRRRYALSCAL